jgi:hypothetical protein
MVTVPPGAAALAQTGTELCLRFPDYSEERTPDLSLWDTNFSVVLDVLLTPTAAFSCVASCMLHSLVCAGCGGAL